jgi:uncharacterized phiE125 gp8 family phage protein
MSSYSLVTGPSVEPISLSEAKLFLRVDQTTEDSLITALIVAARRYIENTTNRALCTQTWKLNLDYSEVREYIGINKGVTQSITHIKYFDYSEIQQTLSTGNFQSDILSEPARVRIFTLPACYDRLNTMEIQFVCGYGVAASVPDDIKQAMYLTIGHWYEHRETVSIGQFNTVPLTVDAIIEPYKTYFYEFN